MYGSKTKVINRTFKDQNLSDMFQEMIGGDGSASVVTGKRVKFFEIIDQLGQRVIKFCTGPFAKKFGEYKEWIDDIAKWGETCTKLVKVDEGITLSAAEKPDRKDLEVDKLVVKKWKAIKDHNTTRTIIMVASTMAEYAHFMEPKDGKVTDKWIVTHPGITYVPFKFTGLDLKHIWGNPKTTGVVKHYCLVFVQDLYRFGKTMYDLVTSPDVDSSEFSNAIVESIAKIQTLPELSRCTKAFDKILKSASMLKSNFNGYYRDMVSSKNPNIMVENFISDVAKTDDMSPETMREFRVIMAFYKKRSAGKHTDPKMQKLMDDLSEKMDRSAKLVDQSSPAKDTKK